MVEQFRMGGLLAAHAEVVGRGNQAAPEEVEPDAVGPDARGQRVVGVGDPAREFKAAAASTDDRGLISTGDQFDESARHGGSGLVELAAVEHARVHGAVAVGGAHGHQVLRRRIAIGAEAFGQAREVFRGALRGARANDLLLDIGGKFFALGPSGARGVDRLLRLGRNCLRARIGHGEEGSLVGSHLRSERQLRSGRKFDELGGMVVALRVEGAVASVGRQEDSREGVVVLLRNRVELVIVATRAGDGETEHALGGGVELLVGEVHLKLGISPRIVAFGADGEVTGGNKIFTALDVIGRGKQVAGDLLGEEAVVGLVFVEGLDDIVAVAPGVRVKDVRFFAARFGVTRDIKPVASPALAERGAGEHGIDRGGEGGGGRAGGGVGVKGGERVLRRREPREVKAGAAKQGVRVGASGGGEAAFSHLGEHEAVDRVVRPLRVGGRRGLGIDDGSIRPVRVLALRDVVLRPAVRRSRRDAVGTARAVDRLLLARVGRAHGNPLLKRADFLAGELPIGRHLKIDIEVAHRLDQQTRVWIARNERRSAAPALADGVAGIEPKLRLGKIGRLRMAAVAVGDEDRADFRLEELEFLGGRRPLIEGGDHRIVDPISGRTALHAPILHEPVLHGLAVGEKAAKQKGKEDSFGLHAGSLRAGWERLRIGRIALPPLKSMGLRESGR